ncbi:MAG: iron ABC transporter permease [Burkholderiaceae bacterium]
MRQRPALLLALAGLLALLALVLALTVGSEPLGIGRVLAGLAGGEGTDALIVRELRLPRALAALGCGAALAVAGALLQALLRNPLADPYVLGMSGGAAAGALLAVLLLGAGGAPAGALLGALTTTALVFMLGRASFRLAPASQPAGMTLVLVGVILAAACGALVSLLMVFLPDQPLRAMIVWLMGDFGSVDSAVWVLVALSLLLPAVLLIAPDLNLLATGEIRAQSLGVRVARRRVQVILLAAALTAAAVQTAGPIGFVGLVVPHLVRLAVGNDQRLLLPLSALVGAGFLVLADTVSRTLFAPTQLPVGAVTAAIGVPVFLWLLLRRGVAR